MDDKLGFPMDTLRHATLTLFERYLSLLNGGVSLAGGDETSEANLAWMCETVLSDAGEMPIDKMSRWLGFVQGVLAVKGFEAAYCEHDRIYQFSN